MCTHVKRSFQYVLVLSMMPRSYVYLHKITLARQILLPVIYHNFLSGQHLSLLMYLLCTVGNNGTCTHPLLRPILAQKIDINKFLTYPNLFYPDGQITVVYYTCRWTLINKAFEFHISLSVYDQINIHIPMTQSLRFCTYF